MRNIRLDIEYDGSDFHGWQRQLGHPTIQAQIEDSLSSVMESRVVVHGASRTDSGVHALGQVANFWGADHIPGEKWRVILNDLLPRTVRITDSSEAPIDFHAQRHAKSKVYDFRILNRMYASALDRRVLFVPRPVDWDRVRRAMPHFLGTHDFRSFQGAKATVLSTVRTIYSFELFEDYPGLYRFRIEGNGFLKQMVRSIVGTLLGIGEGRSSPEAIPGILKACDRHAAGRTSPAHGLCLVKVNYGPAKGGLHDA